MNGVAPRRKGWCPGALRPMETGDGLLARVRPTAGRLSLDQAEAIAEAALACGNGAISLSARGNLQVRGVSEKTLPDLHARLGAAGLIDADPEVERLRNIVASPLSDIDPDAAFDLAQSVAALEARLMEDESLRRLPAKFSFVLDARGRLPLSDVEADIRFEALRNGDAQMFAAYLAGDDAMTAVCGADEIGEAAARLAHAFLALTADGEKRRMRALVERIGARSVFAHAGLDATARARSQAHALSRDVLGGHAFGSAILVGAAAPFGAIEAGRFKALIARARTCGARGVRLAPWRSFFVIGLAPRPAASFVAAAANLGFILHADDPRLRVVACPGAPACLHAQRPLTEDAVRWAGLLPKGDGVVLHVSGCSKGCARPAATPATLVATKGAYDLIVDGAAGAVPAQRDLSASAIDAWLASWAATMISGEGPRV